MQEKSRQVFKPSDYKTELKGTTKEKITHSWITWVSFIITSCAFIGWCYDHFSDNNPKLTFTIVKEISLLNEKANIPSFHVLLDSIDIKETNSNISIYSIRIANEGKQHIITNMYDGNVLLLLKHGKLVSKPIIANASSLYINSHLQPSSIILNDSTLKLPCVPLDKDDSFVIDLIILHPNNEYPQFNIEGKISGQKELVINRKLITTTTFIDKAFGGGVWVNIVRWITFFFLGCNFIIIYLVVKEIPSYIRKGRRTKIVNKITSKRSISQQVKQDFIIEDDEDIQLIYRLIFYPSDKATKEYKKIQEIMKSNSDPISSIAIMTDEQRMMQHMVYAGYWNISGDDIVINKKLQREFKYLYKKYKKN
jgi:hypothetical protein